MTNKTISINPSLFSVNSLSKTKKNREKNSKPNKVPLISPNKLKDKILKRIKEHKIKETEGLENNNKTDSTKNENKKEDISKYTDEFNESIEYLQSLSEQSKREKAQNDYSKKLQRRKDEIQRKTLKSYTSYENMPEVNLDLPDDLRETLKPLSTEEFLQAQPKQNMNIQVFTQKPPTTTNNVPYGVLKGGNKPTYRQWVKTQKNSPIHIHTPTHSQQESLVQNTSSREHKLQLLKKKMQENEQVKRSQTIATTNIIAENTNTIFTSEPTNEIINEQQIDDDFIMDEKEYENPIMNQPPTTQNQEGGNSIVRSGPYKKTIKRTIRKKYKLGKSKKKRQVGILIKDSQTRKNVINSHKELKRTPIKDCKKYLQTHNLINLGGGAPNDVIRATFESAMLAGEITNINKDTMLNNILNEEHN